MPYKDPERRRATRQVWEDAHRDQARARAAAYAAAHREELRAKKAAYRAAHREELRAKGRAFDAAHREEKRAYERAYRRGERRSTSRCVLCEALLIVFKRPVPCPLCTELPACGVIAEIVL